MWFQVVSAGTGVVNGSAILVMPLPKNVETIGTFLERYYDRPVI